MNGENQVPSFLARIPLLLFGSDGPISHTKSFECRKVCSRFQTGAVGLKRETQRAKKKIVLPALSGLAALKNSYAVFRIADR